MVAAIEIRDSGHTSAPDFAPRARSARPARLWAVAGGKGGVGKSIVASSLAVDFAGQGHRVVLVDGDLGGANLHTLVGIDRPRRTLSDFLVGDVAELGDVAAWTSIPNLRLVGGADALLDMANPKHARKEKLLRHLRALEADHVIVDVGAGSAFNTLDLFLAAERGVLVIDPEPTSVENAIHFLKAAFFRSLREVARRPEVRRWLERVLAERGQGRVLSPRDLVEEVAALSLTAGAILADRVDRFAPLLVVNQARGPEDRELGWEIQSSARDALGAELEFVGALDWDERVLDSVRRRVPVRQLFPGCAFSQGLSAVADRLLDPEAPSLERAPSRARLRLAPDLAALPPLDLDRPADYLRRCREQLGLSLSDVQQHTRIPCLARIESGRFEDLPPRPYLRGFVLLYARTLGIGDAPALARAYLDRAAAA